MTKIDWRALKSVGWFAAGFAALYFAPLEAPRVQAAIGESLFLAQDYAREHVILCLLPAFWIAGAIAVFVSQASVLRFFGPTANRSLAFGVASVSGTILAVCSCTVLPLFAGIYRMGAGLGPATAFLYSGPAINVLAITLTAKILGFELGLARAVAAILFSILLGLAMQALFRREQAARIAAMAPMPESTAGRPLWQTASLLGSLVAILVFANWGRPMDSQGFFGAIHAWKWTLVGISGAALFAMAYYWLKISSLRLGLTAVAIAIAAFLLPSHPEAAMLVATLGLVWCTAGQEGEAGEWFDQTWTFAKQIMPLLLIGVLVAGFLLGRPGHEALIPSEWIQSALGGESLAATFLASLSGVLMYFATLTELPILQGLIGNGMGKGPALSLLLAGPPLSLPSMLVLATILGWRKTLTFAALVVAFATGTGYLFGQLF